MSPAFRGPKPFRGALQLPSGRPSRYPSTYQFARAAGLRRQKPARWMSLRSGSRTMLPPQRLLDFVQHLHAFGVRLPFPEHQKTLTANTTVKLSIPVSLSAQHLHVLPLEPFSPKHPSTFCYRPDIDITGRLFLTMLPNLAVLEPGSPFPIRRPMRSFGLPINPLSGHRSCYF